MGIHSISGNYSPLNSLSNGIIILESFLTNLNILATKVGKNQKSHIGDLVRERVKHLFVTVFICIYFLRIVWKKTSKIPP
jgi:hypothetical protein